MTWERRKAVRKCKTHEEIQEHAIAELRAHGFFNKEALLTKLGHGLFIDAIRWDYLREWIVEETGVDLVPLAERFFKGRRGAIVRDNAGAFLAGGNGKRCKGYASVTFQDGVLAIVRVEQRANMIRGQIKSVNALADNAAQHNPLIADQTESDTIPRLAPAADGG